MNRYLLVRAVVRFAFLCAMAAIGFAIVAGAYEIVTRVGAYLDGML